ncbi:MAG: 2Fe-2S iron-sulfur cluster-binding protein [Myxococcota bacterium]|jgi:NADH dehydrogenase/NADH:ubiquinone oxidoreductase subunit G|nr:2Fe-2S iron-sulfur cluster-binding protein [Myxococcota bacterium]
MITFSMDNRSIAVEKGTTVLKAAQANGIEIPTLCASDALTPYGACRLCVVEVEKAGKRSIQASCSLAVEEGMIVRTQSARVIERRQLVLELLLARCPEVKVIQDLAREYNVADKAPQWTRQNETCILCGLCVRACAEVVGANAIQFAGSGASRVVASAFDKKADDCVACGSCVFVCPTGHVKKIDLKKPRVTSHEDAPIDGPVREIINWKVSQPLKLCKKCKNPFAPANQLEKIQKQFYMMPQVVDLCPTCRTYPQVDKEKCLGCGSCMESCPVGAIELDDRGGYDKNAQIYKQNCMACHTCEYMCPVLAIGS